MKKLLVVLLVLGLASPVMAAQFQFQGSFRTHLGYFDVDEDFAGGPAMDSSIRANEGQDDSGVLLNLGTNSTFQAVGIASDKLMGVFQVGLNNPSGENVYLRLAYGEWNFGSGKLRMGKSYTPATFLGYSAMSGDVGDGGDANMLASGLSYIGRKTQLRLIFGDFDFALIEPNTDSSVSGLSDALDNLIGAGTYTLDNDFVLPRVEAAYVFRTDLVNIRPIVGLQIYDVEANSAVYNTSESESVTSWLAGIGASFKFGAAYLKATFTYLQNPGNYGQLNLLTPYVGSAMVNAAGDIEDATEYKGTLVVGMKINDTLGVEAGFGYSHDEVDGVVDLTAVGGGYVTGSYEQNGMVYYLQLPITAAQGVRIIPEIGAIDRDTLDVSFPGGSSSTDLGKMFYANVNFRVDF